MTTKILVDSACDLTEEYYTKLDIDMVPLTVHLNNKEYKDGFEITPKTVYDAMRDGATPKTSQVSPQTFKTIFTSYAEAKQPLVYLAFSSELSGTYQTAKMIEQDVKDEYPEAILHVIDTKCASIGYALVARRAAKLAIGGADVQHILDMATYQAEHMEHISRVDELAYFYRRGRVSRTAASVGSLRGRPPLLPGDDGTLTPPEKIRGSKKVLN